MPAQPMPAATTQQSEGAGPAQRLQNGSPKGRWHRGAGQTAVCGGTPTLAGALNPEQAYDSLLLGSRKHCSLRSWLKRPPPPALHGTSVATSWWLRQVEPTEAAGMPVELAVRGPLPWKIAQAHGAPLG